MHIIKLVLTLILSFFFGFGLWYLLLWFITNESNLFEWHWGVKILYLLLGFSATTGILNGLIKEI